MTAHNGMAGLGRRGETDVHAAHGLHATAVAMAVIMVHVAGVVHVVVGAHVSGGVARAGCEKGYATIMMLKVMRS